MGRPPGRDELALPCSESIRQLLGNGKKKKDTFTGSDPQVVGRTVVAALILGAREQKLREKAGTSSRLHSTWLPGSGPGTRLTEPSLFSWPALYSNSFLGTVLTRMWPCALALALTRW